MSVLPENIRTKVTELTSRYPNKQALTLPICHMVQDQLRCVPNQAIEEVAELLDLAPSQVADTLSFYGFFRDEHKPLGKKRIWVCRSLACMLRGGDELLADVCERLNIHPGDSTQDGYATVELAECLGACDGAPCILIDDELQLNVTVDDVVKLAKGEA